MTITNSIIRITTSAGETMGTGFVVANDLAITCAHIVDHALGRSKDDSHDPPTQPVKFFFYASGEEATATVEPGGWRGWYDSTVQDIAILRLNNPLPRGVESLPLWWAKGSKEHPFNSFGFPEISDGKNESHVAGYIRGLINEGRWLQISSDEISPGVSGGPIFDIRIERVVGVISEFPTWKDPSTGREQAGDKHGRHPHTNHATSTEALLEIWPELRVALQPDPYTQKLDEYRKYIEKKTRYVAETEEDRQDVIVKGIPLSPEVGKVKVPLDEVYIQLQVEEYDRAKQQQTDTAPVIQIRTDGAKVRTDPDLECKVVGCLKEGDNIPVVAYHNSGRWWQIEFNDSLAWVADDEVDFIGNLANVPLYRVDTTSNPNDSNDTPANNKGERSERISPVEALKEHKRLVILGEPGSGKSTLLRWLARQIIQPDNELNQLVPILVSARDFSTAYIKNPMLKLRDFAIESIPDETLIEVLKQVDNDGQVLWLVDALDEARSDYRLKVVEQAQQLGERIVITSRPVGSLDGLDEPEFKIFKVLPLVPENINKFITDWFELFAEHSSSSQAWVAERHQWFKESIDKHPRLKPLVKNPLLLTFLVSLASDDNRQTLPENRSKLYQEYIDKLIINWERQREAEKKDGGYPILTLRDKEIGSLFTNPQDHIDAVKHGFVYLGWQLHLIYYSGRNQYEPEQTQLTRALVDHLSEHHSDLVQGRDPQKIAQAIIQFWLEAGLLDTRKTDLIFHHNTFQEYAVAKYLHQRWERDSDKTWHEIKPHLYQNDWREPLLLLAGLMEHEQLEGFIDRVLQNSELYDHPQRFFTRHKFVGTLIIIPFALLLFPFLFVILAVFIPGVLAIRLLWGNTKPRYLNYRYIRWLLTEIGEVLGKQQQENSLDSKPRILQIVLKATSVFVLSAALGTLVSFKWAKDYPKYYGEKIQNYFLAKWLQQPNAKYLKKNLLAATQHEILLAAKLIGENPTKISDKTAELIAERLAKLLRSDVPSLARAAAEAAAGISEGAAGSATLNILIQDIYKGTYWGGYDDDGLVFYGMPFSAKVLRQQAKQKQMTLDTVDALLSELRRASLAIKRMQNIFERRWLIQYPSLLWAVLADKRRIHCDVVYGWILEILGYYDGEPPDELVQIVSDEVKRRHSDFTMHLAQCLVRWKKATPEALAVLEAKICDGSPSKELLDTIADGFSTGQISGDSAEDIIWCIVRSLNSQEKESIKIIFSAILGLNQPQPDVARIAVLIAIEAHSKTSLEYRPGPFLLITSIMSQILASEQVTDAAFDALAEGLAHHTDYVRDTAAKILHEVLHTKSNLNADQILRILLKALDNDEKQARFLAAKIIKDAVKANIINGALIVNLDPSGYNYEDAISDIQSYYQWHLNSTSHVTTPERTSSKGREGIPGALIRAEAALGYYPLALEARVLSQKLEVLDKAGSSDREFWQNILAKLKSVAKSEYIPEEWLEPFIQLYEDIKKKSIQDEKLISGLPGYESADKLATELASDFKNKYGDKWPEYFKIANSITDAREAMGTIVDILANAALNDVLNSASVEFLLREDTLKHTTNFHFYITVYANIAKCGFANLKLVETLLGFLDYTPSYLRSYWKEDKNPAVIYILGQVYNSNPEFKEQILPAINQALSHNRYEEVDMVTKLLTEQLIPATELAPVILESFDASEEISSSQTRLLGQLSTQYTIPTQYVRRIFNYILGKWTPLGWTEYLDGFGLMIQQETCEPEAFHLIVSRFLYGVHHLGPQYDEFRQPVARILVAANIVQPEAIDLLFTVINSKNWWPPDQNWLDAARFIGDILNTQENEEKCLLSTFHYLLDDSDDAFGARRTDWLKEITVQLLGFVDFQTNTDFLLDMLCNQTAVRQPEMMRVKAVFALTQIGYRHSDRHKQIIDAFQEIFFEEPSPLPPDDDSEFSDRENMSLKMAIVRAIGNLQNYSLEPAKKILLKALEYRSRERYPNRDLSTVAAEAFAQINLEPDMREEIAKLLISLSSPNDETRDAAWKVLNTLDVEAITSANRN